MKRIFAVNDYYVVLCVCLYIYASVNALKKKTFILTKRVHT